MTLTTRRNQSRASQNNAPLSQGDGKRNEEDLSVQDSQAQWDSGVNMCTTNIEYIDCTQMEKDRTPPPPRKCGESETASVTRYEGG